MIIMLTLTNNKLALVPKECNSNDAMITAVEFLQRVGCGWVGSDSYEFILWSRGGYCIGVQKAAPEQIWYKN